jgi:hypothetical protein
MKKTRFGMALSIGILLGSLACGSPSPLTDPSPLTNYYPVVGISAQPGSIQVVNGNIAPSAAVGGAAMAIQQGVFPDDQYVTGTVAALAPYTSDLDISAASHSGSNTTYAYTLVSGSAPVVNQQIYISGMAHAGNNGNFFVTSVGAGTFTVVNASGVSATERGTGISPSDSNVGLVVRGTADAQNGYILWFGTNSGVVGNSGNPVGADARVYDVELWKTVNGTVTYLTSFGTPITSIPDQIGDVYGLMAVGTTISVFKNGVSLISVTDASLASGSLGVATWSVSGAGEWANPTQDTLGNSGQQIKNVTAHSVVPTLAQRASDSFAYSNGDLRTANEADRSHSRREFPRGNRLGAPRFRNQARGSLR